MAAWLPRLLAAALLLGGCKGGSNLTDEQAAARDSQGVEDVCVARTSDDDVILVDRIFAGTSDPSASSSARAKNSWFMRMVVYDAATGQRKHRVTIDKIRISRENSEPERVSCLGWSGDKLWLWSRREGLHARDGAGKVTHVQGDVVNANQPLSVGLAGMGFAPDLGKVVLETKDGRRWLLGTDLTTTKATGRPRMVKRRRSMGRNFRIQAEVHRGATRALLRDGKRLESKVDGGRIALAVAGKPIGDGLDFKRVVELLRHEPTKTYEWDGPGLIIIEAGLDQRSPRTIHRVNFDGKVLWQIREPEACAAPFTCSQAAWQPTSDAKRLYFFGKKHLYAYDASSGKQVWRTAY